MKGIQGLGELVAGDDDKALTTHNNRKAIYNTAKTIKYGEALVDRLDTVFPGFKKKILDQADSAKINGAYVLWGRTIVDTDPALVPIAIEVMAPQVFGMYPNIGEWITALKALKKSSKSKQDFLQAQSKMEEDRVRAVSVAKSQSQRSKYLKEKLTEDEYQTLRLQAVDDIVEVSKCPISLVVVMSPLVEATMFDILQPEASKLRVSWDNVKRQLKS